MSPHRSPLRSVTLQHVSRLRSESAFCKVHREIRARSLWVAHSRCDCRSELGETSCGTGTWGGRGGTVDDQPMGRRVAYWRNRRRMSQQLFADRLGKSKSWVDKVERGGRRLDRCYVIYERAHGLERDAQVL